MHQCSPSNLLRMCVCCGLRLYTCNLLSFHSQLQAPTYGLGEQAASMIRAAYNDPVPTSSSNSVSVSPTSSSPSQVRKSAALPLARRPDIVSLIVTAALVGVGVLVL